MKTVFEKRMLAHVWAQRNQAHGRTSTRNFSFDAGTLYSYSAKIAHFVADRTGHTAAVLLASRKWSVTTSSHQRLARDAVFGLGLPLFEVANVQPRSDRDHLANYTEMIATRDAAAKLADRARSAWRKDSERARAERLDKHAAAYAALFIKGDPSKLAAKLVRQSAKAERERKQREAERAAAIAVAKIEVAPIVNGIRDTWRRSGDTYEAFAASGFGPYSLQATAMHDLFNTTTLLRVNGDNVETSRGAEFPVEHAKRAFRLLAAIVARGQAWEAGDHAIHLGHFKVDRVAANGDVHAGCHVVQWSEVELCAASLGMTTVDA